MRYFYQSNLIIVYIILAKIIFLKAYFTHRMSTHRKKLIESANSFLGWVDQERRLLTLLDQVANNLESFLKSRLQSKEECLAFWGRDTSCVCRLQRSRNLRIAIRR